MNGPTYPSRIPSSNVWSFSGGGAHARVSTTDVEPDDTCTQAQAEKWLDQEVRGFHDAVLRLTAGMPITKYQHAAMTSLSYNVGIESFGRSSVLRRHRTGDYFQAADTFLMWNKITVNGKKVVSNGLNNRRAAERRLYFMASGVRAGDLGQYRSRR